MSSNFSVPNPCSKSWNGMQPQQNGRYCGSCQKVVVDFTGNTNEEILDYIAAHPGKKICGAFKALQLPIAQTSIKDERTIRFLAATLLVFGMSLFSCNPDDHPKVQPAETETFPGTTLPAPNTNDPKFLPPDTILSQKLKHTETTFVIPPVKPVNKEEYSTGTTEAELPIIQEPPGEAIEPELPVIGMIMGDMPEFPEKDIREYIQNTINMPQGEAEGTVYVGFTVKADGSIENVKLLRGIAPELDEEALRVVRSMPKWKPGKQNGEAIDVQFNLPVKFKRN